MNEQILNVDHHIEMLLNGMAARRLLGCVDIIILSDHGMASVPFEKNVVKLEEIDKDIRNSAYCFDCAEGLTPTLLPIKDSQSNKLIDFAMLIMR
jgi:predicted AlkP superfamily pyrophosphatase or phosphodiesterase